MSLTATFNPDAAYWAALIVLAVTMAIVVYLKNSRFGLALQSVREDPVSASMAGRQCREDARRGLARLGTDRRSRGRRLCLVRLGLLPRQCLQRDLQHLRHRLRLFGGVATIVGPVVGVLILYGVYNLIGFTTPQYFQLIYAC